ncbi:DUF3883 domain-containing protein [Granulicella aggregans]|uniref:DUF3883 domain-containing protein n=1 Tax=Granulicella aggregans TaxID=474949 RepID=UPI0021DFCD26|nr:DUF3883 domain-containing protein [Granulicella aggregans]
MADPVTGTAWQAQELDAIVADYFEMLAADLSGTPYVKARHRAALMARVARSDKSIEFKHQNISAVLEELGAPWIPGYKPARNYQNAIFDAIERYLDGHPAALDAPVIEPTVLPIADDVFVLAPIARDDGPIPRRLQQLVRKFDPVERDHRNRSLGKAGEAFILDLEQRRLHAADRADLARKVRWVADVDGDGAGYDIYSFDPAGNERLLEVKTTNGSARTPFFLSRNECAVAAERPEEWRLYRVHLFAKGPRVFTLAPPLDGAVKLTTEVWRASF